MKFHSVFFVYFACNAVEHQMNTTAWPSLSDAIYFSQKLTASDYYKLLFMGLNPALPAQVGTWLHFTKLGSTELFAIKYADMKNKWTFVYLNFATNIGISATSFMIQKYIDGSEEDCSIAIANALEILQSCAKPLT